MPFLRNGGLFLPSSALKQGEQSASSYKLQDSVCLLLQLLDDSRRHLCITKVVWITPAENRGDRRKGIGLHFERSDTQIRSLIESKLIDYKIGPSQSQTL